MLVCLYTLGVGVSAPACFACLLLVRASASSHILARAACCLASGLSAGSRSAAADEGVGDFVACGVTVPAAVDDFSGVAFDDFSGVVLILFVGE